MKILLVDDCEIALDFLTTCIATEMPKAEVNTHLTTSVPSPGKSFDWSDYDLLLLDYDLGHGETGVDWLREHSHQNGFPATILITAESNPYVVAQAMKHGAKGYLNKTDITPARLIEAMEEALKVEPEPNHPFLVEQDVPTHYRIIREIGRGAMSRVHLAERNDGATAVVKVLDQAVVNDGAARRRFELEGELLTSLNSRYVAKIFDYGFTGGVAYLVMEFFGRGDLKQRLDHGVRPQDAALYLYNIARGLEAIHSVGIVHRDLKPANVMFRGDESMALVDFGIAKRLGDPDLTELGTVVGTPHYMSPEQATGIAADPRSDLYSAGMIFYELLTGCKAFAGDSLGAVIYQHLHHQVPELTGSLAPYQPLMAKLSAKAPDDRLQSARQLCRWLTEFDERIDNECEKPTEMA